MLYAVHDDYQTTVVVGSRGTSKTAVIDVLYSGFLGTLFSKRKMVTLSATGFRGGQLIFEDAVKWMTGGWPSQTPRVGFIARGMQHENLVKRAQNFWQMDYESGSSDLTVPTNDPDKLRGIRGHVLKIDEANTVDWRLVSDVAERFLNVGDDFEHGGEFSRTNRVIYTSTIDFNHRPFQEAMRAARAGIQRDIDAADAQRRKDWERYEELRREGLGRQQYIQFDYTDTLITERITTRDGRRMRVKQFPNPKISLFEDVAGIPFSERHPDGGMLKRGSPVKYYRTYPIQKDKLEEGLFNGTAEEGMWLAEERNITESAIGDVYTWELVAQAANESEYSIRKYRNMPDDWKTQFSAAQLDYTAPLLWECKDPCVIGVDYATQKDFSAFVVIRLGPCAEGEYNYNTHHGFTPWCNVVWAEQHANTSHKDVADKIRELMLRYNIVWHHEPWLEDTWKLCRGIGLDMRGGGSGVRDLLAYINDQTVPEGAYRIYDPLDRDPRIMAFASDPTARPMLDAIWPSAESNDRSVTFTVAQMEQGLLYIAKWLDKSQRPRGHRELDIGYDGVLGLCWQLRKLRQEQKAAWRHFFVEGDDEKTTNKKDYWAAFIYAAKQARAHIIRQKRIDETPPPMGAIVTQINKGGHHGRVSGTRDQFQRYRGYRRLL